ncbi:MAG: SdrD B-like domain-containing protein, partial [Bacteroidota bacterium]
VKPQPTAEITAVPTEICSGETVTFTADNTGANAGATFSWNFGANAIPATATGAGPHTVTYTLPANQNGDVTSDVSLMVSRNGCSDSADEQIRVEDLPEVTNVATDNPTCGEDNGSITFTFVDNPNRTSIAFSIDGEDGPFVATEDDQGTFTIDDLDAGTYDLWVRWGNEECPLDLPDVTLTDENAPDVNASEDVSICDGGTVELTASATGGTGTITFTWEDADGNSVGSGTSVDVSPTETTTYVVTASDGNTCEDSDQVTVTVVPDPSVSIEDDGNVVCEDGTIRYTATVSGGLDCGNVVFEARLQGTTTWGPAGTGSITEVGPGLAPGTYEIRARYACDGIGCDDATSSIETFTIVPDPEVTISINDNVICLDETATLTAVPTGGIDCQDVIWERGIAGSGTFTTLTTTGNTLVTAADLEAGDYEYRARLVCSGENCDSDNSNIVTLTVKPDPAGTVSADPICAGEDGTLTVTMTTGDAPFSYAWEDNSSTGSSATYSALMSTTDYEVTVTDDNGCDVILTGTITVKPQPVAEINADPTTICDDESVTFTATATAPGTNYNWNFGVGANPATADGAGPHVVTYNNDDPTSDLRPTVTLNVERDGCTDSDTQDIRVRPQPEVTITAENDPTVCEGTNGSITFSVVKPSGTSVEISLDGGDTYESCDQTSFTGLSAGTYNIFARYCNDDCPVEVGTVVLTDPDAPVADISGPTEVCEDASEENTMATFTATDAGSGATYSWNFGAGASPATSSDQNPGPVTYTTAGSKTITLTVMRNGCTAGDSFTLEVNDAPDVTVDDVTVCFNSNATLEAAVTGGEAPYSYRWSNGDTDAAATYVQVRTPQMAMVTVTDANGCVTVTGGMISLFPRSIPDATDDITICEGESTTLRVERVIGADNSPYTYRWYELSTPGTILSETDELTVSPGLGMTTYVVELTDKNGCIDSDPVEVTVEPSPTVTLAGDEICAGETARLTAMASGGNGSFTYEWSTGETTSFIDVSPTATTEYGVTVTSTYVSSDGGVTNCTDEATATVIVNENPVVTITDTDDNNTTCSGEEVTLTANITGGDGSYTIAWTVSGSSSIIGTEEELTVNPTETTTYVVTVTDGETCGDSEEITITVDPNACASLGDFVFVDDNGNGLQDPGEGGVEGVKVELKDASGIVIATDFTDGAGIYGFENLVPGDYSVVFSELPDDFQFTGANAGAEDVDSDAAPSGPMQGMTEIVSLSEGEDYVDLDAGVFQLASIGDFVFEDTNGDGIQDPGEEGIEGVTVELKDENGDVLFTTTTDANGLYEFTELTPGEYSVRFVLPGGFSYAPVNQGGDEATDSDADPAMDGMTDPVTLTSGEENDDLDAGLLNTGTTGLGDFVFLDDNANGQQDAGEEGIEGVEVTLLADTDGDGEIDDVVATTTTDANGAYEFLGLTPGVEYVVDFDDIADFERSPANAGDDATDSDAGDDGQSPVVVLTSGEFDDTIDAGYYENASLGDFVFEDNDGDGIQDAGEEGIEGVTVELKDENGDVLFTTTTDA